MNLATAILIHVIDVMTFRHPGAGLISSPNGQKVKQLESVCLFLYRLRTVLAFTRCCDDMLLTVRPDSYYAPVAVGGGIKR